MSEPIWDNPDFMAWFNARPKAVQEVIRRVPPDRSYKLGAGPFPVTVHSYDEEKGGGISLKVDVHSPMFPRRVFGVKPEDLKPQESRG